MVHLKPVTSSLDQEKPSHRVNPCPGREIDDTGKKFAKPCFLMLIVGLKPQDTLSNAQDK